MPGPGVHPGFVGKTLTRRRVFREDPHVPPVEPGCIFISHTDNDSEWMEALHVHLKSLERSAGLRFRSSCDIEAGEPWKRWIEAVIDVAAVAVLLVSRHYLASEIIMGEQLPRLLRARSRGLRLVPVLLGDCLVENVHELHELQFTNQNRPLEKLDKTGQNEELVKVAREIGRIMERRKVAPRTPQPEFAGIGWPPMGVAAAGPAPAQVGVSFLAAPYVLWPNRKMVSPNGNYILELTQDGRLQLFRATSASPRPIWSDGRPWWKSCRNASLEVQRDGNLVIYDNNDMRTHADVIWASNTRLGDDGLFYLAIRDSGDIVMYCGQLGAPAFPIWSSRSGRLVLHR